MNTVCLVGRLTRDPELRYTPSGTAVCNFNLAVDRRFKSEGQPTADFINIVAWSASAEFAAKHYVKGLQVSVVGRIQTR
ncbi:MAG: single-stranded DNA-binding protein, partial [Methanofastidiosum sp.]